MAIHRFVPSVYYNALGTYPPVLHVGNDDTVITTTVDARGLDANGAQAAEPGNPQTGPFFVDGAEPGDMLAVHLDRLWPNRTRGWSGTVVVANAVEPDYVREMPRERLLAEWDIDLKGGTATLVAPETKAGRFRLPLAPMVGCFGVAPPRGQALSAATSSTHGGNMDYRGFVQGVTVYFPVAVPGALFFIGDGHAVQGAGEIVGTGIEISFDVQFTLRLLKGRRIAWPRAENDAFIMAIGNARPLDQALQHATTEMLRWLQEDYGLDDRGAHTLLGLCAEYEVGNVCDPAYTMVCKVAKQHLPSR